MEGFSRQLLVVVQLLLFEVLVFTKIVGVTHWKLQENTIVPASAASSSPSSDGEPDELFWSSVSGEDPEFSVLVKRTTGAGSGSGSLGTVAGVPAGNRNCGRKSCPRSQQLSLKGGACMKKAGESDSSSQSAPRYSDDSGPM